MKKIIIADDVAGWLAYNKKNLVDLYPDAEIFQFSCARDAYDFALGYGGRIDIVITDLQMETMEQLAGEWLVENLKTIKSTQLAKYFLVSSCWDIKYIAQRVDANGYLRKTSYINNPSMLQYMLEELGENI